MSRSRAEPHGVGLVVAAVDAATTAEASLRRFDEEVGSRGEVVVVDASRDGTADRVEALRLPNVRVLRRPPGRLVPELWRDGLLATEAPIVAFSTAAMVAAPGWLDALLVGLDAAHAAGVGGPIEPGSLLAPIDQALYLLRYVGYHRPLPEAGAVEPPGDNALYRRAALLRVSTAWADGFWEAEVHRALIARGERLAMASGALVRFHGGATPGRSAGQRHRHAWRYGAQRAARMGLVERLGRTATAPAVPCVLLRRIAATLATRGDSLARWAPALPWLGVLLTAWSTGEAFGLWTRPHPDRGAAA